MPDLFLIFSHTITPLQEKQAHRELGVEKIIAPPRAIRNIWAAIPPDKEVLLPLLQSVFSWLDRNAQKGDFVLIQGDFGASFLLVRHALHKEYIPVYSTTERKAVENKLDDGEIRLTHIFRHVCFRRYGL